MYLGMFVTHRKSLRDPTLSRVPDFGNRGFREYHQRLRMSTAPLSQWTQRKRSENPPLPNAVRIGWQAARSDEYIMGDDFITKRLPVPRIIAQRWRATTTQSQNLRDYRWVLSLSYDAAHYWPNSCAKIDDKLQWHDISPVQAFLSWLMIVLSTLWRNAHLKISSQHWRLKSNWSHISKTFNEFRFRIRYRFRGFHIFDTFDFYHRLKINRVWKIQTIQTCLSFLFQILTLPPRARNWDSDYRRSLKSLVRTYIKSSYFA